MAGFEVITEVVEGSPWIGKKLKEMDLHGRYELLPMAIRKPDGNMKFNPRDNTVMASGDVLFWSWVTSPTLGRLATRRETRSHIAPFSQGLGARDSGFHGRGSSLATCHCS